MEAPSSTGADRGSHVRRLTSQSKNMLMSVHQYFQRQWGAYSMGEVDEKTATATGVCVRTVQDVKRQAALCHPYPITSPPKRPRSTISGCMDKFDEDCIRREILAFYERGELPTLDSLLTKVRGCLNFRGCRATLWKIVREMGFRYRKVESGRRVLMERQDIVDHRNKYLREIERNRRSDRPKPEVYLDETWVNQRDSVDKCWTVKDGSVGPKTKSGKGARFIILHAGSTKGFIEGALLTFKSLNGCKGDYHDSMNHQCFRKWFEYQLLPNIDERSLIIMDNASYHSRILNKAPRSSNRKSDIIHWLTLNNIRHDPSLTKSKLLEICKENKTRERYEIDELAAAQGHEILRLPPYHCELNPIELIWAKVKTQVKKQNSNENQTVKRVESLIKNAIETVTASDWQKCIEHTKKLEDDYRKKDVGRKYLIENLVIRLDGSDDDSSDEISNDEVSSD